LQINKIPFRGFFGLRGVWDNFGTLLKETPATAIMQIAGDDNFKHEYLL